MSTAIRFLDEHRIPDKRLGRHVEHDPRSRAFAFSRDLVGAYQSAIHRVNIPVLNQGDVGSCTGNAAEAACGTDPLFGAIPTSLAARPTASADADEAQAVALYSAATKLDDIQGQYPPSDTGSSGLAVAKAAQRAGLIAGYQHTFDLDTALRALAVMPVITGVNWYEGFDQPDQNGLVKISGSVRGGHEFLLYGIDVPRRLVLARNSWGTGYGLQGQFYFSFDDLGRLLSEQGDVTVFVPLSQSPPTPTPTPTPTPASVDQALVAAFDLWRKTRGV